MHLILPQGTARDAICDVDHPALIPVLLFVHALAGKRPAKRSCTRMPALFYVCMYVVMLAGLSVEGG